MALLSSKHKQSVTGYGYNNTVKRIFYANDCGLNRHKPTRFSIAAPLNVLGINKLLLGPKLIRWRAFNTTFKTFLKCWWDKELLITSCTTYPMSCFMSDKRYQRSQQDATLHNKKTKMKNLLPVELWQIKKRSFENAYSILCMLNTLA